MSHSFESVAAKYLAAKKLSSGTCKEYRGTVTKWSAWGKGVDVDQIGRVHLRDFLDWVHEKAAADGGSNAGRTANKTRENMRAILSWAWVQDFLEKLLRFPKPKPQREVAGRHYLTKADLNALYFATYQLYRPRGWRQAPTVGHHWRAALVVFFNYGVDTGTVFKTAAFHEPILWRHVCWRPEPPNGQGKDSRYGWLYYRRVKTKKQSYRPMNRVVKVHLKSLRPDVIQPDQPVFDCGTSRPNAKFQQLCNLAGVKPKHDVETGEEKKWVLKDLRDLLRRAHAGIVDRDPRAFRGWRDVPPLRPPRPTRLQGDHVAASVYGVHRADARVRRRVPVLS